MNTPTMATSFAGWIPTVNVPHHLAFFAGYVFQNFEERAKGQVAHLPTPYMLHRPQVQRLKKEDIVPVGQLVSQFEKPVMSLVGDALIGLG